MNPIIFLDIDGVLNNTGTWVQGVKDRLDRAAIATLNRLMYPRTRRGEFVLLREGCQWKTFCSNLDEFGIPLVTMELRKAIKELFPS